MVMESVSPRKRGLLSGLLQEGYALGFLLAAAAYYLVFPSLGWRSLFFIGGLPALLTLFIRARVEETEAWKAHRSPSWGSYLKDIRANWKLFLYLIVLMSMMNMISHGTQDLYPTFLQQQLKLGSRTTAVITMISMVGAIMGGLMFGRLSDRWGRKRMMALAAGLGILLIPLWLNTASLYWIVLGAFLMQFMVQGAWGVIPAHINELSPGSLRGFFPGFAYQTGVLVASSIAYVEAVLAKSMSYAQSMEWLAGGVLALGALVILVGPEQRGKAFAPQHAEA